MHNTSCLTSRSSQSGSPELEQDKKYLGEKPDGTGRLPAKMALIFHAFLCQQLLRCYLTASFIRRQSGYYSPALQIWASLGTCFVGRNFVPVLNLRQTGFIHFCFLSWFFAGCREDKGRNKNKIDDERYMFMSPCDPVLSWPTDK